jgi:hypothetical protein
MAASLDSAWSKWKRGRSYLEALKIELGGPMPNVPWAHQYPAVCEAQPGGLEYRFYVTVPPLDGARYAPMVGDCLFNLRCALDHAVYALHENVLAPAQFVAVEGRTQFPILDAAHRRTLKGGAPLPTSKWRDIGALGDSERRRIEFFQPYNGTDAVIGYDLVRYLLSELQRLNNIDKHRSLHVVQQANSAVAVPKGLEAFGFKNEIFWGKPLDGETEVFRWTFDSAPPDIAHHVQMSNQVTVGVALTEAGKQSMLLPTLQAIIEAVEVVLNKLAPLL